MDKIRKYASWFGGTLERIAECDNLSDIKHERLDKALTLIDRIVENKFEYHFNTEERILLDWLDSKFLDDIEQGKIPLSSACRNGRFELFKDMLEKKLCAEYYGEMSSDVENVLMAACQNGHLELAKYIYNEQMKRYGKFMPGRSFDRVCEKGYLDVAKWLVSVGVDYHQGGDFALERACKYGQLGITRWLVSIGLKISDVCIAYAYNHLELLKWMDANGIDVLSKDYYCAVCKNKNLPVLQWLVSMGMDIHMFRDLAFHAACLNGYLEQAKWAYEFGVREINCGFLKACYNNHLELAKWIYEVASIDLDFCKKELDQYWDNEALLYERLEHRIPNETGKWLYSLQKK